jgi:uncharacterized protein YegP (UPF0339 family)
MYRLHEYTDRAKHWRWRLVSRNGKYVACSGEGYHRRATMRKTLRKLFPWLTFVLVLSGSLGCRFLPPPPAEPTPPPAPVPQARTLTVPVSPASATATVTPQGDRDVPAIVATGDAVKQFLIPGDIPAWGADLVVTAEGFVPYATFLLLPLTDTTLDPIVLATIPPPPPPPPDPPPPGDPCAFAFDPVAIMRCVVEDYQIEPFDPAVYVALLRDIAQHFNAKSIDSGGRGPFGLLRKTSGHQCLGFSCDSLCAGQHDAQGQWDIWIDSDPRRPIWGGPLTAEGGARIDVCEIP